MDYSDFYKYYYNNCPDVNHLSYINSIAKKYGDCYAVQSCLGKVKREYNALRALRDNKVTINCGYIEGYDSSGIPLPAYIGSDTMNTNVDIIDYILNSNIKDYFLIKFNVAEVNNTGFYFKGGINYGLFDDDIVSEFNLTGVNKQNYIIYEDSTKIVRGCYPIKENYLNNNSIIVLNNNSSFIINDYLNADYFYTDRIEWNNGNELNMFYIFGSNIDKTLNFAYVKDNILHPSLEIHFYETMDFEKLRFGLVFSQTNYKDKLDENTIKPYNDYDSLVILKMYKIDLDNDNGLEAWLKSIKISQRD